MADFDYVEIAKKEHMVGIDESITRIYEAIERLQVKLDKELVEKEMIEKIKNEDYEVFYKDKILKIKARLGIKTIEEKPITKEK